MRLTSLKLVGRINTAKEEAMQKYTDELMQHGLWGEGLLPIKNPELVARYRRAQQEMGLQETKLTEFRVDALGWSPEIAEEMGDKHYLSHGVANPLGIILSAQQRRCPIYVPYHSFDWELLKTWYDNNMVPIRNTTAYEPICLDIDQAVDAYRSPEDLRYVEDVTMRAWTPGRLMQKARRQKQLVRKFMDDERAHLDVELISSLEESVKEIGDLRYQQLFIPDMHFTDLSCFYSRAFGGQFVMRNHKQTDSLLIGKSKIGKKPNRSLVKHVLKKLQQFGLITQDSAFWQQHLHHLLVMRDGFLAELLPEDEDYNWQNPVKYKRLVSQYENKLPKEFWELDNIISTVRKKKKSSLKGASIYLYHPDPKLSPASKDAVWHLLALVCGGRDVLALYRFDKEEFFQRFQDWKTPYRRFAIAMIKRYYIYRMMQPKKKEV